MAVVPSKIADRLAFYEQHLPIWATDPTAIGLNVGQISNLATFVADARAKFDATQDARADARAATTLQTNAMATMSDLGADLIKTIRAYAETTNDPNVYGIAQIPPPAPPTPAGPPDKPTELEARILLPFGIGLTWKGTTAQSAYFGIWRQLPGETAFSMIKTTSEKSFEDRTLPGGIDGVVYYIAAVRDSFEVNSASLTISFGADGTASLTLAA